LMLVGAISDGNFHLQYYTTRQNVELTGRLNEGLDLARLSQSALSLPRNLSNYFKL
jgi:hypothetical protein